MKHNWLIAILSAITVGSFVLAGKITIGMSHAAADLMGQKPNVLVVSVCSMRKDLFEIFGHEGDSIMPNSDQFFRDASVVYHNAFNSVSWISIISYLEKYFPLLSSQGVLSASPYWNYPYIRVPIQKAFRPGTVDPADVNDSEFEKDYKAYFELVKQQLLLPRVSPFMLITHIKYLHYPLIDRFNQDSEWDYYLTPDEKARVQEYLRNPDKFYAKLPLLLMLTSDPKYAVAHPVVAANLKSRDPKTLRSLLGLVSNPQHLAEWKASADFEADLRILKKAYAGNARYLDRHILGPLFDLFGDPKLQKNTMVVFTGDHGEMHMERGHLTHADSGFDEAIAIPAGMRFPRDWQRTLHVKQQVNIADIADTIEGVVAGTVTRGTLDQSVQERWSNGVSLIRDCRNTLRGLRYENKFKYIVDAASGARQLYDLEKDPGELVNIADSEPETVDRMEMLYWENLDRFKWMPPFRCLPW